MPTEANSRPATPVPRPSQRWWSGAEAATVFLLLLAYIWYLQARLWWGWMPLLGAVLLSHALRGETPRLLGFRRDGFTPCARLLALPVLGAAALLAVGGAVMHTIRPVPAERLVLVLVGYPWWALLQQYLLNGYFLRRLGTVFGGRQDSVVAILAGLLFAAAHAPNPLLMAVALIGGSVAASVYLRYRNLFVLALAHALIGTMLWLVVPDSIGHHLRVGPGMWQTDQRGPSHTRTGAVDSRASARSYLDDSKAKPLSPRNAVANGVVA